MSWGPVRLAVGLCALIVSTFITSCLVATLTQPLERIVSVMSSVWIQQKIYADAKMPTDTDQPVGATRACLGVQCVVEVDIGDADYESYFKGVSPLSPAVLSQGVDKLVALAREKSDRPAAVVWDLDLSYGKADASQRNPLFDNLIRLSSLTPVLLVCPKAFIDSPERVGWREMDYLRYIARHNAANVAAGGGVYFFRSGIDRFALFYDQQASNAGRVAALAMQGSLAERREHALHPGQVCRGGTQAEYGNGTSLIKPVDDAILKTAWADLHTGDQDMMYGGNILLIGGSYLGNDKFSMLSGAEAVSGSRLHGYIIQEQLAGNQDAPAVFSCFFDVAVGMLSGFAFMALWRMVARTEPHYAANLLAHGAFFVLAILLPLLLLWLTYRFSQSGISFASAGMVVSALFDAFFAPQETEDGELLFEGHTRSSLLAVLLLLVVSVGVVAGMAYNMVPMHALLASIALGCALQWHARTRSGLLVFLCAALLATYFLLLVFHHPQSVLLAWPLLIIALWLYAFSRDGRALLSWPGVAPEAALKAALLSRPLQLFAVAVLVSVLPDMPAMDAVSEWQGVQTWLVVSLLGGVLLWLTDRWRPDRWRGHDLMALAAWESAKNLIAINVLAEWLTPSDYALLLPWPVEFMLAMLLLLLSCLCFAYGRIAKRQEAASHESY